MLYFTAAIVDHYNTVHTIQEALSDLVLNLLSHLQNPVWNHLSVFPLPAPAEQHDQHRDRFEGAHHTHKHNSSHHSQTALPPPFPPSSITRAPHRSGSSTSPSNMSAQSHSTEVQGTRGGTLQPPVPGSALNPDIVYREDRGSDTSVAATRQQHHNGNLRHSGAQTFGSSPWLAASSKSDDTHLTPSRQPHSGSSAGGQQRSDSSPDSVFLRIQLRDVEPLPPDDDLGFALLDVLRCVPNPGSSWEQWVTLQVGESDWIFPIILVFHKLTKSAKTEEARDCALDSKHIFF